MLLATIDHTSSPNDADLNQPYDEAAEYELPQLIDRYFKRLFERFGLGPQQQRAYGTAQYLPAFDILRKAVHAQRHSSRSHWLDELSSHQRRKKEALDRLLPPMAGSFQMTNAELSAQLEQIERSNDPHHDFFSEM
ncbi:hypothetical protein FOQG_17634 [Fusarium oxysporum f. sp. raphani 54005]|uniref:Uncharacterized protein n=1 Tax=Fusarium oxysporum f. sp. raphani 54005 TaxID=1089458 RepID=X0B7F6_FUSOX|nr:hypothetical protein FOQG_17634 [Fusarium oxysporum f. sp. raphani 54005]